jgi:nucleotide-binding universal stress UspA family protein
MRRKAPFKTVLFLVETSTGALDAARVAVQVAKAFDARLVAVAVVDTETLKHLLTSRILAHEEMKEMEEGLEVSAHTQLAYVAELARTEGLKVESVLLKGDCHHQVLHAQHHYQADLLVLAPFRPSMATRDLMAGEKHLIADQAECPVLILR